MARELTIKEYADRERVTERTVYRWIKEGRVANLRRTPGGAVRIPEPTRGSPGRRSASSAIVFLGLSDKY